MRRPLLLALVFAAACSAQPKKAGFKDVPLPTLDGSKAVSLASCPTARCLTVYVAPWCGYCRRATPMIRDLRKYLETKGVSSRVVVGLDEDGPVRAYAREFGGDTLLDSKGVVETGGVPHFFLSDAAGAIVRNVAGAPPTLADAVRWVEQ